jgi:PKD repeat protein
MRVIRIPCYFSFSIVALILMSVCCHKGFSQCSTVDFTIPATACLQQNLSFTANATFQTYEWDFCSGDLDQVPASSLLSNGFGGYGFKVELVQQNGLYFGFFLSRGSNKLYRLDFGTDINTQPQLVDLGGLGRNSSSWRVIEIVQEAGQYYGFIIDSNVIYRIDFGTSLINVPSAAIPIYSGAPINAPFDLVSLEDGSLKIMFVANLGDENLVRLKFDQSYTEIPTVDNNVHITGAGLVAGISFIRECDKWYGLATSLGSIYKISFGYDLLNDNPVISALTGFSMGAPSGLSLVTDNGQFYAFVQSQNPSANLYKLNFGNSLSNVPTFTDFNNIGLSSSGGFWGFSMHKVKSDWLVLATENSGSNIFRVTFPNNCFSLNEYSTLPNPALVTSNSGSYRVSLNVADAQGYTFSKAYGIIINNQSSPDIDFTSQNICVSHDVNFVSQNSSGDISAYDWDFGDATAHSASPNPVKQFGSPDNFIIDLKVTANNSCENHAYDTLRIYDPPIAGFASPSGLICTNNKFAFLNTTTDDFDGNLYYQWLVNNSPVSSDRDLEYVFTSNIDQDIKLQVSIPGCSDETETTITGIQLGPTVGFTQSGQCEQSVVNFTNTSSGDIAGYSWDFGNGDVSTDMDPTEIYSKGNYSVTLSTIGNNGCISTTSKDVIVYSKPQPNFSIELPPFSCSGTPSQFTNTTLNPTDSNITAWTWNFGDDASGTSIDKDPLYTFAKGGDYEVTLTATTNFNCSASFASSIAITPSPPVNFINTPSCVNQGTHFTDQSGNDIKSWFWKMESSTYSFNSPIHVFSSPGNYNVQLTVVGNNDCVATLSKAILVPVPPTLDFSFENACAAQTSIFQDISPLATDPVSSQLWDFAGVSGSGSPASYSFILPGTYAVKMVSTQQSGCTYTVTKNVTIAPTPVAQFSASPEFGVPPLNVQFTNQSTGADTYLWRFNDENNSTSIQSSPAFQFTDLGDYVVDLVATNTQGCSTIFSSKISVIIPSLDLELKELNLIKDPTSGFYRIQVTVKNNSNFTLTSADILIDISGGARIKETVNATLLPGAEISQLLSDQIIPSNLFFYLCAELDVANDIDEFNDKKCESVADEGVIFYPYPNPSNGLFRFDWISLEATDAHISIINSLGQTVFKQDLPVPASGLNQMTFDLTSFNEGTYFFKFSSNTFAKTVPIVIVR